MIYVISGVLIIIILLIAGLITRKKIYDEVDRQETWKLDIMNRDVAQQLSKIKKLNLSGETQEKFEIWKDRWEEIVTKELPNIEEYLFDAEEAADRYRFPSAKKAIRKIDTNLQAIEDDIDKIINELDELIETEEATRLDIEEIQPALKVMKKELFQNRYQYGKAEVRFEVRLDELEEKLAEYFNLAESGNYLEAKNLVDEIKADFATLKEQLEAFPDLYRACKQVLPDELDELFKGIKEMKNEGYQVEYLGFEKEIREYQERLVTCVETMEKGEIKEAFILKEELEERMKEMYQLLEKEAVAKNYTDMKVPVYQSSLEEVAATFVETQSEVEELKNTYFFDDLDMEKYLTLEKTIERLQVQFQDFQQDLKADDIAHSELRDQLERSFNQLEEIKQKHHDFKDKLMNLRKDELKAKENLSEMREQIQKTFKKLTKSNIPGVPNYILDLMDQANKKNDDVVQALEKQPLDMSEVQYALSEAKAAIDQFIEQTDIVLDQAYLTEQVIQYANRYRSKYPELAEQLAEAERLFRNYEYELSLEKAAQAIEGIEPGALKRIEEFQSALQEQGN